MEGLANLVSMLDYTLDTDRKRHIIGGILFSVGMFFGGLALTVISIHSEEVDEEEKEEIIDE